MASRNRLEFYDQSIRNLVQALKTLLFQRRSAYVRNDLGSRLLGRSHQVLDQASRSLKVSPPQNTDSLPTALAIFYRQCVSAASSNSALTPLADLLTTLEVDLHWYPRCQANQDNARFSQGHRNCEIISDLAGERAACFRLGMTILAPHVQYPLHQHAPSEIYLALSPGEWFSTASSWWSPGTGGIVLNPANALHGMRSGTQPLLAIWMLFES